MSGQGAGRGKTDAVPHPLDTDAGAVPSVGRRQLIVVECRVADDLANLIAFADFAGMIVPLRHPIRPAGDGADVHVPDL